MNHQPMGNHPMAPSRGPMTGVIATQAMLDFPGEEHL